MHVNMKRVETGPVNWVNYACERGVSCQAQEAGIACWPDYVSLI